MQALLKDLESRMSAAIEALARDLPAIVADIRAMDVDSAAIARAIAQLGPDGR